MIKSLGYVTVAASDIDRWRQFAFGVLGFAEGNGPDPSALYLRMDERAARIIVVPGDVDRVLTVGWEVRDHAALERVKATLDAAGVAFKELSAAEADERRVEEVITFEDPAGTTLEVFHGAVLDHSPVVTPFGARFVTGDQGLGHVVLPAIDPSGLFDFYTEVLGLPVARRIPGARAARVRPDAGPVPRHQRAPPQPGDLPGDEPGQARVSSTSWSRSTASTQSGRRWTGSTRRAFQLSSTLGRHTNDKMVSFYVRAPGDWDIEFGTDGMRVDERYYTAEEITADSYWGHQWVGRACLRRCGHD